jgi:ParB-like chromosome segregation protein Spo0J
MNFLSSEAELGALQPPYILLTAAVALTGVPYDTFVSAHRAGRLAIKRDPGHNNDSIEVSLYDLVTYMVSEAPPAYRWSVRKIPMADIVPDAANQPRLRNDRHVIKAIADRLRIGGPMDPVWVIENVNGRKVLIDGFRRYEAHKEAQIGLIAAVVIRLPWEHASVLVRECNRRHGENLTEADLRGCVIRYLKHNPSVLEELRSGKQSQAELASLLNVSRATITRALKLIVDKQEPAVSAKEVLLKLKPLYRHLAHAQPDDSALVAYVAYRALSAVVQAFKPGVRADLRQRLKLNSSAVSRSIHPTIRGVLDRRGGDRRPKTRPSPPPLCP